MTPVHRTAAVALALTVTTLLACEGKSPQNQAGTVADATPPTRTATAPDNGYGDKIAWRGLEEGLKESAATGRPLMLVVHASWCPRCKELKKSFFDPNVVQASEQMIMVNLDQDANPEAQRHGPDGQYIPRILFFDAKGQLDADIVNPKRKKFKYFYTPQDDLPTAMQQAVERHPPAAHL